MSPSDSISRRFLPARAILPLLAMLVVSGCGEDPIVDEERSGDEYCDNLDEGQCLFPFPTDFYRTVENGKAQLRFPDEAIPYRGTALVSAEGYLRNDGFSAITPIYFTFDGATLEGTPPWNDIDSSLKASSRTVIVDVETGEFVPHWAEIDVFSMRGNEPTPVIALRLPQRLKFDRRYVVAVQSLVDEDGKTLAATPGFAPLRDKEPSRLRGIGQRREHYEKSIFPVLDKAGVKRADLQLAWDFTTATEANVTGPLLAVRDAMFELIGDDGPAFEIDEVLENPDSEIARRIRGRAFVPSFMEGPHRDFQRVRLDADGKPVAEGTQEVEFELQIPVSVWEGNKPGFVVNYGHGLLGDKGQARGSWLRSQANEQGFLILGVDMHGMSSSTSNDLNVWLDALTGDGAKVPYLSDKPQQGLVNHLAVIRMLKGPFKDDARVRRGDDSATYDPEQIRYYGISQGGTMGGVMMSIHKDVTRGVLGVPGGGFSFLLTRATLFVDQMGVPMMLSYMDDMRDFVAILGLVQIGFDRIDAVNFLPRVTENPFPGTPSHTVLLQAAREDAQVHNQVTDLVARAAGAKLISPSVREVWGLEKATGPVSGNAMVEYDFGLPHFPNELVPMELDHSHGCLRKLDEAREQINHFFLTGETKNTCPAPWGDGACFVPQAWNEAYCR